MNKKERDIIIKKEYTRLVVTKGEAMKLLADKYKLSLAMIRVIVR